MMNEATIELNGDMPKYLMNGAFFYDFARDLPLSDIVGYAYRYFARYPALSIGHHPLLLGIAEAPFFYLFGISVFSARLTVLVFSLIAVIFLYKLVRSVYNDEVALVSVLLFVSAPAIVNLSRVLMSEVPTLSLVLVSSYLFYKYCKGERNVYIYGFTIAFVLSMYSKQTAVLMFPVYLIYFFITKGYRKLMSKHVFYALAIGVLMLMPLVPLTLKFSQHNVDWTKEAVSESVTASRYYWTAVFMWRAYPSLPVWILAGISICLSLYKKDKRVILFAVWMAVIYLLLAYTGAPGERHTIYYIPALCLLAAALIDLAGTDHLKRIVFALMVIGVGYQSVLAYQAEPQYATGYEDAARYIVENKQSGTVMYSGIYDTGFFIFFVRKHNADNDLIILRADKVLATSNMMSISDDRIKDRSEIYEQLNEFGVRYVVLEETSSESQALRWLGEEVKSDRFILRKQIIIKSNNQKIEGVPLSIYEYKGHNSPRDGQLLRMNIPLMGDSIVVPLKDLKR